ncbi:MAG: hypothetical protein E6444_03640 [Streptococcus parasanguinis]|uniref:hypothetical protein n=1 Tax=Streptococcus parasanguinis TaxID=1318 RepID=UPI00066BD681|nr:hypothetical protein [Streptococcus parasanguinis]MDU6758501.1 hypothetical protein [Streptococcus parasanguinis]
MKKLTLEALYTLHLMNDKSNDLPFIPLSQLNSDENRKSQLQKVLQKGYKDLENIGLIQDGQPTAEFVAYGYFLDAYAKSSYHFQIDSNYYCAPGIDKGKRMVVIVKKIADGEFIIDYFNTIALLSILIENHEILHNLDGKKKNYLKAEWEPYAYMKLQFYYKNSKMIRLMTEELGKITADTLFFNTDSGLFEYDLMRERIRSVSVDVLKHTLIKGMKVRA